MLSPVSFQGYSLPLAVMLYLPEGNHCGSSEPAWVASSWVLTPPTQSCLHYSGPPNGEAAATTPRLQLGDDVEIVFFSCVEAS